MSLIGVKFHSSSATSFEQYFKVFFFFLDKHDSMFVTIFSIFASSAHIFRELSELMLDPRSLMKMINVIAANSDPCGTPLVTCLNVKCLLVINVLIFL